MKFQKKQLTIFWIVIAISAMLYAFFRVYTFSTELIHDYKILNLNDYIENKSAFLGLLFWVGLSSIFATWAIIYMLANDSSHIVYVEKQELRKSEIKKKQEKENEQFKAMDFNTIAKGQKPGAESYKLALSELCNASGAMQGVFYLLEKDTYQFASGYAMYDTKGRDLSFKVEEGLCGQAAAEKKALYFTNLGDKFRNVASGLGENNPDSLLIVPVQSKEKVLGIVEIAFFGDINDAKKDNISGYCKQWGEWLTGKETKPKADTTKETTSSKEKGSKK